MMSSDQYRFDAETSPGSEKFGSEESAILCARPMPVSDGSLPPHHTGTPCVHGDVVYSDRFRKAADAGQP